MESTQHTLTISHASYMANSTSPEFLSLCPISLSDLQCKLCQHIVDQHCTINISCAHSSTEGYSNYIQVCKIERNTQTVHVCKLGPHYIVVGSHLHNTSIQLHNVYFIFPLILSSQGVVFRPLFFEYKLLIPYTHPFVWTRFTSPLSALSSSILCSVCIGTAELHVTLELLSILQTENIGAPTPQMQYFVIVSQWVWSSSPGAEICCGQRIMLQW